MNRLNQTQAAIRRACAIASAIALVSIPTAALANDDVETAKDAGMGLGSGLASLIYAPTKVVYALGGILVGGLAFAFSGGDVDVARVVIEPSVLGDYVVTTDHLTGDRPVRFFGQRSEAQADDQERYREEPNEVAAAPDGW